MSFNTFITSADSLVTTHEQTRAGFLSIALEKNKVGDPYVKNALAFKSMVSRTTSPDDFLRMPNIRPFLLTASGLSEKSMNYLTEEDQTAAIKELIEKFLKPAGKDWTILMKLHIDIFSSKEMLLAELCEIRLVH